MTIPLKKYIIYSYWGDVSNAYTPIGDEVNNLQVFDLEIIASSPEAAVEVFFSQDMCGYSSREEFFAQGWTDLIIREVVGEPIALSSINTNLYKNNTNTNTNTNKKKPKTVTNLLGEDIVNKAINIINTDRKDSYGDPENSFNTIANYWTTYLNSTIEPKDVIMMMVLLKIAREQKKHKEDNLIDIIGYTALLCEVIKENS